MQARVGSLAARELFADWDVAAASTAAHLHALEAEDPDDQDLRALVGELLAASPEFARRWPRHDVRRRRSDRKPFRHPLAGEFTLSYEVPHLDDGQRMTVYQAAPGSRDHDAAVDDRERRAGPAGRRFSGVTRLRRRAGTQFL